MYEKTLSYLREMFGAEASFRAGQWQAIDQVVRKRERLLIVQRTGWGKSIVYFLATRLLRDQGRGVTLLISPLLSLMRNQIRMAEKIGLRAATINSSNVGQWKRIADALAENEVDVLLISPERLSSDQFLLQVLPAMENRIGLFVVDEAHCISDWGHDFRPDYQRIVRILNWLPRNVPVIGVTATANDRVVNDVVQQFGSDLQVIRGPLMRQGLRLRNIVLSDQAERLAWLAENLSKFPGSGIIYTMTVADSDRVALWLQSKGYDVRPYHSDLSDEERRRNEDALLDNELKALSATVALGMGFDKPDIYFVIHFQRPGNVVAYYQQVGRAGRALRESVGILLAGREDDDIQNYFIDSAFPPPRVFESIVSILTESKGCTFPQLKKKINASSNAIQKALKLLEIQGAVTKELSKYHLTLNRWRPDYERYEAVTKLRKDELKKIQEYVYTRKCLMKFLAEELSDPVPQPCGVCGNCSQPTIPGHVVRSELTYEAVSFLRGNYQHIMPRSKWAPGVKIHNEQTIPDRFRLREGRALCRYGDMGWGDLVKQGKYNDHRFSDELLSAACDLITAVWQPSPYPLFVTFVPSLRLENLVKDFALRLANALDLQLYPIIKKRKETRPQKEMANSTQQLLNIKDAFEVIDETKKGPCLLVDDVFDSRWTFTVVGYLISKQGSGPVYPFALAKATQR